MEGVSGNVQHATFEPSRRKFFLLLTETCENFESSTKLWTLVSHSFWITKNNILKVFRVGILTKSEGGLCGKSKSKVLTSVPVLKDMTFWTGDAICHISIWSMLIFLWYLQNDQRKGHWPFFFFFEIVRFESMTFKASIYFFRMSRVNILPWASQLLTCYLWTPFQQSI